MTPQECPACAEMARHMARQQMLYTEWARRIKAAHEAEIALLKDQR